MTEALGYMYYTFDKFVDLVFNTMVIVPGVTFGWVVISIMLFAMLIKNILNVPRSMGSFDKFRAHSWDVAVRTPEGTRYSSVTKKRR